MDHDVPEFDLGRGNEGVELAQGLECVFPVFFSRGFGIEGDAHAPDLDEVDFLLQ